MYRRSWCPRHSARSSTRRAVLVHIRHSTWGSPLLARIAPGRSVIFSADAAGALYACRWPLNIRELESALAAALAVTRDRMELQHLPTALRQSPAAPLDVSSLSTDDRAIRDALVAAIARHDGNLAAVAR